MSDLSTALIGWLDWNLRHGPGQPSLSANYPVSRLQLEVLLRTLRNIYISVIIAFESVLVWIFLFHHGHLCVMCYFRVFCAWKWSNILTETMSGHGHRADNNLPTRFWSHHATNISTSPKLASADSKAGTFCSVVLLLRKLKVLALVFESPIKSFIYVFEFTVIMK